MIKNILLALLWFVTEYLEARNHICKFYLLARPQKLQPPEVLINVTAFANEF